MLTSVFTQAQSITLFGFATGSSMADGDNSTYSVIGEPFSGKSVDNGYEVTKGLAQTQLERLEVDATVNYGEGYSGYGFSYPTTTPAGDYTASLYSHHGGSYRYDLLKTLKLKVLGAISCGELVYDGDNHEYHTVAVAGYCWTQTNLRATHYADGSSTEIVKALVYTSLGHPNATDNENTFGRLYTWYSAVNVPENSTTVPASDADGYVQGICPVGWHIPTAVEMAALNAVNSEDIRSTELWVQPNSNTNSTGFSALPAGTFNAANGRFEDLLSRTDFWSDHSDPAATVNALSLQYYCNTTMFSTNNAADAWSVRCVKNH
ncbi:MAG: fibrobacter succinogenes major paralogous domain-containing protein [Bacteroidales bacterium]|nr:fibrobacter succinogenes major paralogous domain-containing protein [Bacteroidales bacterium]